MHSRYTNAADVSSSVTTGAGAVGAFAWLWESAHVLFGWATSAHVLAILSVIIAIISSLVGLYYRKKEEARATRREHREIELHKAKLAKWLAEEEDRKLLMLEAKETQL